MGKKQEDTAGHLLQRHWRLFLEMKVDDPARVALELVQAKKVDLRHGSATVSRILRAHMAASWKMQMRAEALVVKHRAVFELLGVEALARYKVALVLAQRGVDLRHGAETIKKAVCQYLGLGYKTPDEVRAEILVEHHLELFELVPDATKVALALIRGQLVDLRHGSTKVEAAIRDYLHSSTASEHEVAERIVMRHWKLFEALGVDGDGDVALTLVQEKGITLRHGAEAVNEALHEHLGVPSWPAGIPRSMAILHKKYGRLLAKWMLNYNQIKDESEDLLQEMWMCLCHADVLKKFVRRLGPGSTVDSNQKALVGYLKHTVHNIFSNWCRKKNRRFVKEYTLSPLEDGSAWEVGLTEEDPLVEFEDRFDLARALGTPSELSRVSGASDGAAVERTLIDISVEVERGCCSIREAADKARRTRQRQRVRVAQQA